MEIKVIASGSTGNCYLINDTKTTLMIEAGINFKTLCEKLSYKIPPDVLITHSHKDHAESCIKLLDHAVNVYTGLETALELNIQDHYRVEIVESEKKFNVGSFDILPLRMYHDVPCLGFLIHSRETNEKLFFATDTYMIDYIVKDCDYIMIEANYDIYKVNKMVDEGVIPAGARQRLMQSHMSIDTTIKWLGMNDLSKVKKIYLMHLSSRHGDSCEFKKRVQRATGKPVTICGMEEI